MEIALRMVSPPNTCAYLPAQTASLEYEWVRALTADEYMERMKQGWRRFGHSLFHPQCPRCRLCQSLRVDVERFQPNRSQRRVRRTNEGLTQLRIGLPSVNRTKLALHRRYHEFQADVKGWPDDHSDSPEAYWESFVHNPFPTEEWQYLRDGRLAGVGYVDPLPEGLSAIYFFYEPMMREWSLGVWNVLNVIEQTAKRGLPHAYLGYYVAGSRSMEYKATFTPNEVLGEDGEWRAFRT